MKGREIRCRWCGKEIAVITFGVYRKVVVDAEAAEVCADPAGEEFVRIDGSKVRAVEAENWDGEGRPTEYAYRPHRCGGRA